MALAEGQTAVGWDNRSNWVSSSIASIPTGTGREEQEKVKLMMSDSVNNNSVSFSSQSPTCISIFFISCNIDYLSI